MVSNGSEGDDLLPEIGTLAGTRQAIEFVELALTQKRPASTSIEPMSGEGEDLADVVVALANLSALLARIAAGFAKRAGSTWDGAEVVRQIGRDQEIRDARRELGATDDGFPFDA